MKIHVPEWETVSAKEDKEEELNPLEQFIYDQEPATDTAAHHFRYGLEKALEFIVRQNG